MQQMPMGATANPDHGEVAVAQGASSADQNHHQSKSQEEGGAHSAPQGGATKSSEREFLLRGMLHYCLCL